MITLSMLNQLKRASIIALLQRHGLWAEGMPSDVHGLVVSYSDHELGPFITMIADAQAFEPPRVHDVLLNVKTCRTYLVLQDNVVYCDSNDNDLGFLYRGNMGTAFGPIAAQEDAKQYYRTHANAELKFLLLRRG